LRRRSHAPQRSYWESASGSPSLTLKHGPVLSDRATESAHRVLQANGAIPAGFRSNGGGPEVCAERLRADGADVQDEHARLTQELRWPRAELARVLPPAASGSEGRPPAAVLTPAGRSTWRIRSRALRTKPGGRHPLSHRPDGQEVRRRLLRLMPRALCRGAGLARSAAESVVLSAARPQRAPLSGRHSTSASSKCSRAGVGQA
jgi:hypothetical protein